MVQHLDIRVRTGLGFKGLLLRGPLTQFARWFVEAVFPRDTLICEDHCHPQKPLPKFPLLNLL